MPLTALKPSQIRKIAANSLVGNATGAEARGTSLSVSQVRTLLGLGTTDSPTFNTVTATTSVLTPLLNNTNAAALIVGNSTYGVTVPGALTVNGNLLMQSGVTASELRMYEPSGSGTNYTAFKAQAQTGDVTYTLPSADGSTGQYLKTDGSGALGWATLDLSGYLPLAGGTLTGNLLFTDNTYTIGAAGATRPSAVHVGTGGVTSAGSLSLTRGGAVTNDIRGGSYNGEISIGSTGAGGYFNTNSVAISMRSTGRFAWSSTTTNNGDSIYDAAISRISAGVIGFGTGAAGNTSAEIRCGAMTASGSLNLTQGGTVVTDIRGGSYNGEISIGSTGAGGYFNTNSVAVVTPSNGRFAWASTTTSNGNSVYDAAISRISAGVIGFGTGAAGNTSAEIRCGNITSSGTISASASLIGAYYSTGYDNFWTKGGTGASSTFDICTQTTARIRNYANNADAGLSCAGITASGAIQETYRTSSLDPTVSDIGSGKRQGWYNTTATEFRDWVNVGGTLYKSAVYT